MYKYIYPLIKWKIKPWLKYYIYKKNSKLLPDEYQQVKYIEGFGSQYINTKFVPNQDTSCLLEIIYTSSVNGWILGSRKGQNEAQFGLLKGSQYNENVLRTDYNIYQAYVNVTVNTKHIIYKNKNKLYVDNVLKNALNYNNFNSEYSLGLFAINLGNSFSSACGIMKLFNCKIYDNETLVRDFIPCYRKFDNEVGLYDLVTKEFYTNQGEGSFTYGGEV